MKRHTIGSAVIAVVGALLAPDIGHAALTVTNGTFGTTNRNAQYVDGGGWFESTTSTNWVEGSWANPGSYAATFPSGSGMACLFDGATTNAYIYQSLGTIDLSILGGSMSISADFAEKADDTTVNCTFTVFAGNFTGAHGTDIAGGGLTTLFSRTLTATDQGLTAASGNSSRAVGVAVNTSPINLTGLPVGTSVWLRIGRPSNGTGDVILDNVAVTTVPEPAGVLLGALGALGLLRRKRIH
ncbi:MAG: hypothetical protein J0M04_23090 [Verrucomicrobia bacterium]|nr:hypothetical protein [Verrucomicrobiota bacterium]